MTIGERILNLIHEKGMTQKEFSALTGIPQSTMSSWKSRNQVPGMDKLQIICDVLDIDPICFQGQKEKQKPDLSEYMKQTLSTRLSKVSENWMMPGKIGFWDIYTRLPAIELLFLEINHPLHPYLPWLNFL